MLGLIFFEFKQYVVEKYGFEGWEELLHLSKMSHEDYSSQVIYSDQELVSLLQTLSEMTGRTPGEIEEEFGFFIAPFLSRISFHMIDPTWKFIDVLLHTQEIIHTRIEKAIKRSTTPFLGIVKTSPNQVTVSYQSSRKMCSFAKGLIKGLAHVYNTNITLDEVECMHKGQSRCLFIVTVLEEKTY